MKVPQYPYLSDEAKLLRSQDKTPPWGVHVCEVDSFKGWPIEDTAFGKSLAEARRLRDEIESAD